MLYPAYDDTPHALFHYTKLNTKKHGYRHEITLKKCFVKIRVSIRVYKLVFFYSLLEFTSSYTSFEMLAMTEASSLKSSPRVITQRRYGFSG